MGWGEHTGVGGERLGRGRGPGRGRAPGSGSGARAGSGASAGAGVGGERRGRVGRGGATGEERVGIWGEKAG